MAEGRKPSFIWKKVDPVEGTRGVSFDVNGTLLAQLVCVESVELWCFARFTIVWYSIEKVGEVNEIDAACHANCSGTGSSPY
uniref:RNase H domain-containing protein n=1 Tax=Ascaris lumbricoides TaxID=6252 RepID=A0A0M3IAX3_ASCLU